ncbi:MAG TPA: signal peptidase II [Longimicrobium sp.]|nr:signal peptidase II [Longimicrobium sp.]
MAPNHPIQKLIRRLMGVRRTTIRDDAGPGRRASDTEPMRGWVPALKIALVVALLDWTTKAAISFTMAEGDFREVIPGALSFWHVRNPAMILGLWENFPLGARKLIAIVAAVVGAVLLLQILGRGHRFPPGQRRWAWLFVGLVLGGMLGNLGERAIHWGVTDFISIRWGNYWLPPGNFADLALFLSVPLSLPVMAFELVGRARRGSATPVAPTPNPVAGD